MSAILRSEVTGYWHRIRQFSPNAQKLIISNFTRAFGWGITQTLFNLYLISLGYSNAFLGGLMSLNAMSMAISSIVVGIYVTRVGPKYSLIVGMMISVTVGFSQVAFPVPEVLLITAVLGGLGVALLNVSFSPFITRSSTSYERTHLFGTSQSAMILSSFLANTLAGFLPGFFSLYYALPFDSSPTFQMALFIHVIPLILSILPLLIIRETEAPLPNNNSQFTHKTVKPVATKDVGKLALRFGIVNIFIGLGAGFVIPYLTIFFWEFYDLPTPVVGLVQGLGSLSVALGVFLSPVLSTRIGKVKTVIVTQSLSLPFLFFIASIINPFVAITSYIFRVVLMNASSPVDTTLRMELVPEYFQPTMSAISGFAWNFPWALSTLVTGPLFDLQLYLIPFWFTLTCYSTSTALYAAFFWNIEKKQQKIQTTETHAK